MKCEIKELREYAIENGQNPDAELKNGNYYFGKVCSGQFEIFSDNSQTYFKKHDRYHSISKMWDNGKLEIKIQGTGIFVHADNETVRIGFNKNQKRYNCEGRILSIINNYSDMIMYMKHDELINLIEDENIDIEAFMVMQKMIA